MVGDGGVGENDTKPGRVHGNGEHEAKEEFLRLYESTGSTKITCAELGITAGKLQQWIHKDKDFVSRYIDLQEQMAKTKAVRWDPNESLCWSCLRAGWDCLCLWPRQQPDGIEMVEREVDGELLMVVMNCQRYWPDS